MASISGDLWLGSDDPRILEESYRTAVRQGQAESFAAAIRERYGSAPENPLYAAWYYRLQGAEAGDDDEAEADEGIAWRAALPLALISGIVMALLAASWLTFADGSPYLALLWSPLAGLYIYLFLAWTNPQYRRGAVATVAAIAAAGAYVFVIALWAAGADYRMLMALHLPLLIWLVMGLGLFGRGADARTRFAALLKSVEIIATGGIFAFAAVVFGIITAGLFAALDIDLPEWALQILFGGGIGAVPVIATAVAYQPLRPVLAQRFTQGLGRLVTILMRLLLLPTLVVLAIYLCFIPFNFLGPFLDRELLIIYNVMLFAVMGLLIGAAPLWEHDLPDRQQRRLRMAILAIAALSVVVGLYALAAVGARTWQGGLTPNRLTVIGWNTINIGLLVVLLYRQWRAGFEGWLAAFQEVVNTGLVAYAAWTIFLVVALPWLFPA